MSRPAVDWLSEVLGREAPFGSPPCEASRAILAAASAEGWVKPAGLAETIWCPECLQMAEIVGRPEAPVARCACGEVALTTANVRLWRVETSAIMDAIATMAAVHGVQPRKLEGRLWHLGDCTLEGARFPIWLARVGRGVAAHAVINDTLQRSSPDVPGVIIALGAANTAFSWARGSTLAPLAQFLRFDANALTLNPRALFEAAPTNAFVGKRSGRPRGLGDPIAMLEMRRANGVAKSDLSKEAHEIRAALYDVYGDRALSVEAIKRRIRGAFPR